MRALSSVDRDVTFGLLAGMLLSSQFNINYFAISEVDQWFTDFQEEWATTGAPRSQDLPVTAVKSLQVNNNKSTSQYWSRLLLANRSM